MKIKFSIADKRIGFYLAIAAVLASIISLPFYLQTEYSQTIVMVLIIVEVALGILDLLMGLFVRFGESRSSLKEICNCILIVVSVVLAVAMVISTYTQVDDIGFVVSGMRSYDIIASYMTSVIMLVVSLVLYIAAFSVGIFREEKSL